MGRFPRLTPVRLSPQVPDLMAVSSLLPYIVASTHKGSGAAASTSELRPSADGTQVFECAELVCAVGHLQTTLAQVLGKCKSVCTCLPFALLAFSFLPGCVELPKSEQVSMDAPIVELPCSFRESIERCRRPQEYTFQPDGKGFDGFGRGTGLSVDLDDMGSVAWTVVFGEASHCTLLQLFDPLDFSLEAITDIDGESRIFGVKDIPLGAALEGVGVCFDEIFESIDPTVELPYFGHMVVFPLFDRFEQRLGDALQGVGVKVSAAVKDVSSRSGRDGIVGKCMPRGDGDRRWGA